MKAKEILKLLNITRQTLYNYVKQNKITYTKINNQHYIYNADDVYKLIGIKKEKYDRINISYSRISNQSKINELEDQSQRIYEYCINKGIQLDKQFDDVKSGMNFNRNGLNEIIQLVIKGKIELLIIENKDRLVRFGYELIENLFKYYGTKIIVISDVIQNKSYEQELTDDLISIIHYFSMKSYSNRRKLNKIKKVLENS